MDPLDFTEIKKKLNNILTKNQQSCQNLFDEYKKSHNNLLLIYQACCILYDLHHKLNNSNLEVGEELIHFNTIEKEELSKLVNQQKQLMERIEKIKSQIKPPNHM
mgnify:CR=1 FL=1